ncbi:MAG TPA: hypothetical protein VL547_23740 [Dinghuibacter sp.]|uniref:hypothetical protein n=1 Tax=Dinghuibacter sp. TaxID=2024697 RepID=UPI002C83A0E9|nr:hypothetical protein [Dinghuibacter sp.]HTJ15078.1 hypothetical protein [Dinghuibacter sp.]
MMAGRLYDASRLQLLDGNDSGIVSFFLGLFLESVPPAVAEIQSAYVAGDLARVRALAHRIKPSILELEIRSLAATIAEIEAGVGLPGNIERLCSVMAVVVRQMREELQ